MRLFRRHRGSQGGNLAPVGNISPPGTLTARQVLTVVLMQVPSVAEEIDYAQTLVDDILLALDANGLSIVASGEIE